MTINTTKIASFAKKNVKLVMLKSWENFHYKWKLHKNLLNNLEEYTWLSGWKTLKTDKNFQKTWKKCKLYQKQNH